MGVFIIFKSEFSLEEYSFQRMPFKHLKPQVTSECRARIINFHCFFTAIHNQMAFQIKVLPALFLIDRSNKWNIFQLLFINQNIYNDRTSSFSLFFNL